LISRFSVGNGNGSEQQCGYKMTHLNHNKIL
jgi:hypothetical protein